MPEQKRGYFSTKKLDFSADGHRTFNPFLSVINGKVGGETLKGNGKLINLG